MSPYIRLFIFFSILVVNTHLFVDASLSDGFRNFLRENYGADMEKEMNRPDMGAGGSFGGGNHKARTPTR